MQVINGIKKVIHLGITPDLSFRETQRTYIFNFYSLLGIPVHLIFLYFNYKLGYNGLLAINLMHIVLCSYMLYLHAHKNYSQVRIWMMMLSTAGIIVGALVYRNGNEYMLLTYLIGAAVIFDEGWKFFVYGLITIICFTFIRFNVNGELSLAYFFQSRAMFNTLIALFVLTISLQLFKLIYTKFSSRLEALAAKEKHSARLYEFLSQTNDLIIHAESPDNIYDRICTLAVDTCGYQYAIVSLVNARDESVYPLTWAGSGKTDECLEAFRDHVTNKTDQWGEDPMHHVIVGGKTFLANDLEQQSGERIWVQKMLHKGYRSFIALPVCEEREVVAILTLFSNEKDQFNENELNVLNRVAENIGLFVAKYFHEIIRKQAETQLKKVTQAVEQSHASIVITDLQGSIEYVNPAFTNITGYSAEEAIGQNPRILKTGFTNPDEYKGLWEKLVKKQGWDGVFMNRKKNGDVYWEKANISPVIGSNGEIINYVAVKEDITEKKKLEDTRQQLIEIFENARVFVLTTDLDGVLTYANAEAREYLGIGDVTTSCYHISALQPGEKMSAEIAAALASTGKWNGEHEFNTPTGARIPVMQVMVKHQNGLGAPMHISITAIDISKVKESEMRLKILTEELRSLSVHLQEVSEKEKADIARELHDELGQILTVMRIDVELLQQHADDKAKLREGLHDLHVSVEYLTEGFRKLLSTINTSLLRDLGIILAVQALVDKFSRSTKIPVTLKTKVRNEQIDLRVSLPVFRLVQESLTNIMKHASATMVSIEIAETDTHLKLMVTDNGKGFDIHKVDIRQHHGLLGMRERIYAIEGDIKIESDHGLGTRISAVVPLSN